MLINRLRDYQGATKLFVMEIEERQRNRFDLMSGAEKIITMAIWEIEKLPALPPADKLTEAVELLGKARDLVYDSLELKTKNMVVYISVREYDEDSKVIVGVSSTEEKAHKINEIDSNDGDCHYIVKWELDGKYIIDEPH